MIRIPSQRELLEAFRPIDRDAVIPPRDWEYPYAARAYASWIEPSGHRAYLVYEDPASRALRGIAFTRGGAAADSPAKMCEWCHAVRAGSGIDLMTADASDRRRVGLHLCRDLSCGDNVLGAPRANDVRETLSAGEKYARLQERIAEFANRNLY